MWPVNLLAALFRPNLPPDRMVGVSTSESDVYAGSRRDRDRTRFLATDTALLALSRFLGVRISEGVLSRTP